jgi:predicted AAA+ superfamily ATPase
MFTDLRPRDYLEPLTALLSGEVRRAIVLLGPRRVGKTVLIHHAIAQLLERGADPRRICYISVDHPVYTGRGLAELLADAARAAGGTLTTARSFVFFDEIQYLKDWERHLKTLVDDHPALRALASGSAAAALRLKSAESGAGRFTDLFLPPLTFREYLELLGHDDLLGAFITPTAASAPEIGELNSRFVHYLNFGGYPEVLFSAPVQADPHRFIKSDIIDKVLLRDLPSLYGILDIQELNALFTALAYNTAGEVSLDELAKRSGVAKPTIRRYIEYLEAAFLVRVVHRVGRRGRRFQRANFFKVYLTNPSMRAALFAPLGPDDDGMGRLVETGIFAQQFHEPSSRFYGRWSGGEVDLVQLDPTQRIAAVMEVKWSDRFADHPDELRSLLSFCRANRLERAVVTTRTLRGESRVGDVRLTFIPAAQYALVGV